MWRERVTEGGDHIMSRSMEKKENGYTLCMKTAKLKGDLRRQKLTAEGTKTPSYY